MGACDFSVYAVGKDLRDAYNKAVEEALYEHGHDSYNGTISTCSEPDDVTNTFARYGTKLCEKQISKAMDTMPKWECKAIELKGKALKEYRQRYGLQRRKIKVYYIFGMAAC